MNHFKDENIIKQLLDKRVIDMTGQELFDLIGSAVQQATLRDMPEHKEKRILHGKKEIASALTVSTSTISRWLENGTIHAPAVIRADRVLLFDYDLVLEQIQASEGIRWQCKPKGKSSLKANRHTGLTALRRSRPDKCRPPGLNRTALLKKELSIFFINIFFKISTNEKALD